MNHIEPTSPPAHTERVFQGIGVSKGIAIGTAFVFNRDTVLVEDAPVSEDDVESELARFHLAIERSEKELAKIATVTEQKIGHVYSDIFTAQIMILHDRELLDTVERRIRAEHKRAGAIVGEEISRYQQLMLASNESLFRERADDIQDLKERIIRNLSDGQLLSRIPENAVVVSNMLTPADVILFSRQNMLGCATESGGLTSHAALICQSLGIPMVVGVRNVEEKISSGDRVALDGYVGRLILNPSPSTLQQVERKLKRRRSAAAATEKLVGKVTRTRCGKRIYTFSNIDFKEELPMCEKSGSDGVGLFRSEMLFIAHGKPPDEDEQFEYYMELAHTLAPKPLTVRLFDVGGDKLLYSSYKEQNPNLGWRGVRILLDVPEILEQQLRALLRANIHGNIELMLPMISSMEEIRVVKKIIHRLKTDLRKEKALPSESLTLGVMIEVPSAVELIDDIAKEVDFVSIGTNDLIQYTLAVDRNNDVVQNLYNKFHPAVVRMVARVVKSVKKHKRRVAMCGEMASDPLAVPLLLGLGLEELSMTSANLLDIKKIITSTRLADARVLAKECLSRSTASEIEHLLKHFHSD